MATRRRRVSQRRTERYAGGRVHKAIDRLSTTGQIEAEHVAVSRRAASVRPVRDRGGPAVRDRRRASRQPARASQSASAAALVDAVFMRSRRVFRPRSASQQSKGLEAKPQILLTWLTSGSKSLLPHTRPRVTSLCPPIILVRLSITRSAPISSGRTSTGVAKVLSTTSRQPASCASSPAKRCRPAQQRVG